MHNRATRKFIDKVRASLNLQVAVDEFANALLICGCGLAIVGLLFIIRGHSVELPYLIIPPVGALLFMFISYRRKRYDVEQAAAYSDSHFALNDALVSLLDFENQPVVDGFHKVHFSVTETVCIAADLERLQLRLPWRKFILSCLAGVLALILVSLDDSPAVAGALNLKQQTVELSEKINRDLRKELKTLEKKLSPAEKKLLKASKLDKLVNDLKSRGKFKDAMRQYAKLEKVLNRLSASQVLKSNRQLLDEIARQLLKDRKTRKLGQHFSRGEYRRAAENIKKLKHSGDKQKNLEQLKQVLDKMKQAAKQLIGNDSKLKDRLNTLKEAIDKYAKAMQQFDNKPDSAAKEKLSNESQCTEEQLDNLSEALEQQQVAEDFIDKLMKMRSAMQKAQQKMRGMQSGAGMPGQVGIPGRGNGKKPGVGPGVGSATAWNRRESGDEISAKGKLSKISGQQGSGASRKKIESAASGSAVSRRVGKQTSDDFKYKVEEFIKRNDVPEGMKEGVKQYFNDLHKDDR
jgi:tetratricopeptide (TPR) repeat protein